MSIKKYGIYLAYPPNLSLNQEGLGRYLTSLLKGMTDNPDILITIACPSWLKNSLKKLFQIENVPLDRVTFLAPKHQPTLLDLYEFSKKLLQINPPQKPKTEIVDLNNNSLFQKLMIHSFGLRGLLGVFVWVMALLFGGIATGIGLIVVSPILVVALILKILLKITRHGGIFRKIRNYAIYVKILLKEALTYPKKFLAIHELYELMYQNETKLMESLINKSDVQTWYCPTPFWPSFNTIQAPRLLCVPDVVLTEFPISFGQYSKYMKVVFDKIEKTIRAGDNFVTYSDTIKWSTLVDRYGINADKVTVIPHAPNTLDSWLKIDVPNFVEIEDEVSDRYSKTLLASALRKSAYPEYTNIIQNYDMKFMFYASQMRPNKNVVSLLRAYNILLKKRFIQHKLILTGNPSAFMEVETFIAEHNLKRDVLFLHGLSSAELAACYKLADLALNPTLSEGGCPFTFTEALSVGTPVVMSRIPVAEEILTDPKLQEVTFFDPYDHMDMANRIEWALKNKQALLDVQTPFYEKLCERSWTDVANDHIAILDRISSKAA